MLLALALLLQDVDALIRRLGSEAFAERQQAVEDLVARGRPALQALRQAAASADPEVAWRAREALDRIGGGGFFDGRRGGTGDLEVEGAVRAALGWLERHQEPDGGWRARGACSGCPGPSTAGAEAGFTGLAVLAFLARGGVAEPARRGLDRLLQLQDAEGGLGPREAKFLYAHAIAALALAEAAVEDGKYRPAAQRAADFTARAQNPGRAWRYLPGSGDNDTSVTFWALQSLAVGKRAGLRVPREALEGARAWLDEVTEPSYGRVGYVARQVKCGLPGQNEGFDFHETMTGGALFLRRLLGESDSGSGAQLLIRDLPSSDPVSIDYAYWHAATLGLYHQQGAGPQSWDRWFAALKNVLLPLQKSQGCAAGSWEAVDKWSAEAGRVYATSLNALTLQTRSRYRRVNSGERRQR